VLSQLITIALLLFLMADFVFFIMCLVVGPKLRRFCRIALWANGMLLVFEAAIGAAVLYQSSPDQRGIALLVAVGGCTPTLLAFLSFAAIYRWKMKPLAAPPPIPR
jgi:hypothetical protein